MTQHAVDKKDLDHKLKNLEKKYLEKYQNLHTKQKQQEEFLRKLEKTIQTVSDENIKQQDDLEKKHAADITKIEKKYNKDIKEMKGE